MIQQTTLILWVTGIWVLANIFVAYIDKRKIQKGGGISRAGHLTRRVGLGLLLLASVQASHPIGFSLIKFGYFSFFLLSVRWLLFDIVLNAMLGRPLFKVGNTAFLDRIFVGLCSYDKKVRLYSNEIGSRYQWKTFRRYGLEAVIQLAAKLLTLTVSLILMNWL